MPTDETTLADRVREARAELDRAMERYANAEHPSREYPHNQRKYDRDVADNQRMLDAYAEAIRAECAAEIAALKADRERLDWLNDNAYRDLRIDEWDTGVELGEGDSSLLAKAPTLREAIDAARASEPRGRVDKRVYKCYINSVRSTGGDMRVWVYPEKCYEALGAERWDVSWEQLTASAAKRLNGHTPQEESDEFDYDRDLTHKRKAFTRESDAREFAEKLVADGATFFGAATVTRQVVDWFVEEDGVAEWADAGTPVEVS